MALSGNMLIAGKWVKGQAGQFNAYDPATGLATATAFSKADQQQVAAAVGAAHQAFLQYRHIPFSARADFLDDCAKAIMALGDELLECMQQETGYPLARCMGERARTCGQLNMQADFIRSGEYLDARIDQAMPERQPLPRPDIRFLNQGIGVIAVFAVSNFPLAYSTAGGDTASALAAGCAVIVKGHMSHPGTGELVAQALQTAAQRCGMPDGVISFIQADDAIGGAALINAPQVKGIGFTGSIKGGTSIAKMAAQRPEPIPVFAEMGSINPVLLLPQALKNRGSQIAQGFVASMTLGSGQFCVNPGLLIAIEGPELDSFVAAVSEALKPSTAGVMLNQRICQSYAEGTERLAATAGLQRLAEGQLPTQEAGYYAQAMLYATQATTFLANHSLQEEVFGPATLLVKCADIQQVMTVLHSLQGQLTGTLQGEESELAEHKQLVDLLSLKVGRMVINGFPTGVEVCSAMVHGGPFPASTDSRFTAVGTAALQRWLRPVCYQDFPQSLLPEALQNHNPLGLMRTVNGHKTRDSIV